MFFLLAFNLSGPKFSAMMCTKPMRKAKHFPTGKVRLTGSVRASERFCDTFLSRFRIASFALHGYALNTCNPAPSFAPLIR